MVSEGYNMDIGLMTLFGINQLNHSEPLLAKMFGLVLHLATGLMSRTKPHTYLTHGLLGFLMTYAIVKTI